MFFFLHFSQGELQVVNVFLQLRAFILQLPLLGSQLSVYFLLILQSLSCLFELGLKLDFAFDESLTPLLSIREVFTFLYLKKSSVSVFITLTYFDHVRVIFITL